MPCQLMLSPRTSGGIMDDRELQQLRREVRELRTRLKTLSTAYDTLRTSAQRLAAAIKPWLDHLKKHGVLRLQLEPEPVSRKPVRQRSRKAPEREDLDS